MSFKSRKLIIWSISLVLVLVIYLLYNRLNETKPIEIGTAGQPVADINTGEFDSDIGMVGDKVGVGPVKKAVFIDLNKKTKEVERKFGFEQLIHKQGDEWEVEKPYMDIFRSDFTCSITADRGKIQVEKAIGSGSPSPKDAELTGNVVIHILPEGPGDIKEGFVYLEDVIFISEKSQFSTAGPVKYISEQAQMFGRGMELIYDEEHDHLEYLRIIHLENMLIRSTSEATLLTSQQQQTKTDNTTGTTNKIKTQKPAEHASTDTLKKEKVLPEPGERVIQKEKGQYYKVLFSKNVFIDTPEQLILADEVFINNIFRPKTRKTNKVNGTDKKKTVDVTPKAAAPEKIRTDTGAKVPDVPATTQAEPSEPKEQVIDIVVTCDNGIFVTPIDSPKMPKDSDTPESKSSMTNEQIVKALNQAGDRTTFIADKINYCAVTEGTVATGRSELTFYLEDEQNAAPDKAPVPVKITAQKETEFLPALNQVIFEGDCLGTMPNSDPNNQRDHTLSTPKLTVNLSKDKTKQRSALDTVVAAGPSELTFYTDDVLGTEPNQACVPVKITAKKSTEFSAASNRIVFEGDSVTTMVREEPNSQLTYTLSAPRLTVDLAKDKAEQPSALSSGIEHLTADGGTVRLAGIKTAKKIQNQTAEELIGGTELKCYKFEYDDPQQMFLATGPGMITADNSKAPELDTETGRFSLQKPCYALVQDFEVLKYSLQTNQIIAYNNSQRMFIDYFPVINGKLELDRQVETTCSNIEINLVEKTPGQNELSTLTATGGITYEDADKQFAGSELFYDANESLMTVKGSQVHPCLFNNVPVDGIVYDLETGKLKFQVVGPGTLQMKRK